MGLVRTPDELKRRTQHFDQGILIGDVTMVFARFRTDPNVVKRLLPPPLKPGPKPLGFVYVAEFGNPNFCPPYNEAGVFLDAQYKNESGNYCLSMPVTVDSSLWQGRETQGYPKKIAEFIAVEERGNYVTGNCIRRGQRIITITVQLEGPMKQELPRTSTYTIKAFPSVVGTGFEYPPLLIHSHNDFRWNTPEKGIGRVTFGQSTHDPIHEIPIKEVVQAGYGTHIEILMQPGNIVAELDSEIYEAYYWNKQDWDLE